MVFAFFLLLLRFIKHMFFLLNIFFKIVKFC